MSDQDFDPSLYASAPIFTIGSGTALVSALCEARLPADCEPANVARARKKLERVGAAAKAALAARQKALGTEGSPADPALDAEADNAWAGLRYRLLGWTVLPPSRYPQSARAVAALLKLLGGEGLAFLKLPYADQWAAMAARLEVANEDGLAEELDELCGPEFLAHVRYVQKRYGAMVRAMLRRDEATGERLIDHVRAMQKAITEYATKVAATVEDEDPESAPRARSALRPIEAHREAAARRSAQSTTSDEGVSEDSAKGSEKPAGDSKDAGAGTKKG